MGYEGGRGLRRVIVRGGAGLNESANGRARRPREIGIIFRLAILAEGAANARATYVRVRRRTARKTRGFLSGRRLRTWPPESARSRFRNILVNGRRRVLRKRRRCSRWGRGRGEKGRGISCDEIFS